MFPERFLFTNRQIQRNDFLPYYVVRAGSGMVGPGFDIERNSSYPYCVIHCVTEGQGYVMCRGKKYNFRPGQLFILGPNEAHRYASMGNSHLMVNWVEFSGGDSARFAKVILDSLGPVINDSPNLSGKTVSKYILRILILLKRDPYQNKDLISKLIYSILLHLQGFAAENTCRSMTGCDFSEILKVKDYIYSNISENLPVEKLASVANFSPAYFAKLFRRLTGNTPAKYIREIRLLRAKEYLAASDDPIEAISDSLGFCSPSHFIRVFKKAEGITPASYRLQCRSFFTNPH